MGSSAWKSLKFIPMSSGILTPGMMRTMMGIHFLPTLITIQRAYRIPDLFPVPRCTRRVLQVYQIGGYAHTVGWLPTILLCSSFTQMCLSAGMSEYLKHKVSRKFLPIDCMSMLVVSFVSKCCINSVIPLFPCSGGGGGHFFVFIILFFF